MLGTLLLLFIVLPALDLFLLLQIGSRIGIYQTLILIVATGFAGAILYRSQKWLNLRKIQTTIAQGQVPDKELVDQLLIIGGALLLVTPGILTDILGFLILLPLTRPFVRSAIKRYLKRKINSGSVTIRTG